MIHEMRRHLWVWAHGHSIGSYGKGTKQMRGGANVFKGKWIVSVDFEARSNRRYGGSFAVLVTKDPGCWNGGIS
jgi:hypothetical protein